MGAKNDMRNLTANAAKTNAANSATDRSTMTGATGSQTGALNDINSVANRLTPGASGQFQPFSPTPYAQSSYAASSNNIADTYAKQREMGMRALGSSGFGASPGANASMLNTSFRNQGADQTGAFRNMTQDTLNQMLAGAGLKQGVAQGFGNVSQQYGGQSLNESNLSTDQARQRVGMGSTAGDILSGFSSLADIGLNAAGTALGGPAAGGFNQIGRLGGFGDPTQVLQQFDSFKPGSGNPSLADITSNIMQGGMRPGFGGVRNLMPAPNGIGRY